MNSSEMDEGDAMERPQCLFNKFHMPCETSHIMWYAYNKSRVFIVRAGECGDGGKCLFTINEKCLRAEYNKIYHFICHRGVDIWVAAYLFSVYFTCCTFTHFVRRNISRVMCGTRRIERESDVGKN